MLKSLSHMNSIRSPSVLFAKKETKSAGGKGFGKVVEVAKTSSADTETATITTSQDFTTADIASNEVKSESTNILTDNEKIRSTKLFRKMKLEKIRSLEEKLKYLKDEETLIASDPSVGAVPELVADRMIKRITLFFGIPVFGGLMIFVGAFFYSKRYDVVVPPAIIAYATQFPFIIGLLGITYAILSSSWDNVSTLLMDFIL